MKDNYVFPRVTQLGNPLPGMELRDWFAGMALQKTLEGEPNQWVAANNAYNIADAMLEIRNGTND